MGEVKEYITEMGYKFDPEAFVAFYESKGWRVGNQSMKSWHAACVTWQKRENERSLPKLGGFRQVKPTTALGEEKAPDGSWFDYKCERYFREANGNYYTRGDKFGYGGGFRIDGTHKSAQTRTPPEEMKRRIREILGENGNDGPLHSQGTDPHP